MKHKLIITESQYQQLLQSIDEQLMNGGKKPRKPFRVTGLTTRMVRVPQWLERIIGNKVDGYKIGLKSDDDLDSILKGEDINIYLTPENIARAANITKQNSYYIKQGYIQKDNPKYLAALIKLMVQNNWVFAQMDLHRKPNKTKTPPPKLPTDKKLPTGGGGEEFPLDGTAKQYFEDNEWVLNNEFKEQFKSQVTDKLKEKLAQGILQDFTGLTIDTSCSRLRNGVPKNSPGHEKWSRKNKRITFPELSQQRNNAAKQYVLAELTKLGVDTSKVNIIQNTLGDNQDGTSGPDYTGGNRVDYNQHKYLRIKIGFSKKISGNIEVEPVPKKEGYGTTTSNWIYSAVLISPTIPYKLPGIFTTTVWDPKIERTTEKCKVNNKGENTCGDPTRTPSNDDWSRDKNSNIYFGPKEN